VSIKTWPDLGPAETIPTPSSPILARFYRSAEGYTYTNPSVIANCSPLSHMAGAGNFDTGWYIDEFATAYFNTATILLKRVNATTWLELRWNSLNHTAALERDPGVANPPYAFELWCSHSATGTLATTRLATWEYDLGMGTLFTIPFDPLRESRYLFAYMLDNVVTFELWKGYPGSASARANEVSLLQSQTYTVPAGLQGVIGSTVAGQAGFAMKIDNPPDTPVCLINTPYVNYLEFSDASFAPPMIECPLIGDVDSPQRIVLGGDLVNPMMMLMIPDEDGVLHSYRVSMTGTIAVGNEVTINLDNGSVTDAQGLNRYGLLDPGSQLPMFQPGLNYITLAANDWNETVSEHLAVYWRDALA
jgi:hypothetical protein